MKMLKVPYKSGWFTVIIPTLTFLIVWFGSFLLVSSLLRGNVSDWMRMLIFGGGIILGLMVSVAIYPLLLRLADRGSGEMQLEGEVLRWRTRRQWQ